MKKKTEPSYQPIPHSRPTVGLEEAKRLAEVVRSGYMAQGKMVQAFEQAFTEKITGKASAAVSSGTAALHLVLLAMGIGAKDEVIIPSYVCAALLNAVHYVAARPVLADIDPDTGNIDPVDAKKRITRRTRAIIVPHMFGLAADLDGLTALGVPIIEDCAQAVGGTYAGKPVGTFGQAAVFSFYATKVMTTGEGGMVVSGSKKLMARVNDLRNYDERGQYKIRYNYKMTDFQAALGLVQLAKLETFVRRRRKIAGEYTHFLKDYGLKLPSTDPGHIYFRYVVGLKSDSATVIQRLQAKGIMAARPVYKPLHHYLKLKGYPHSIRAWRQAVSLPIYPSLSRGAVKNVLSFFTSVIEETGFGQ